MVGMKGRTPTAAEKQWMNRVSTYGCYCCRRMGLMNDNILIHHVDGRTKPGAHFLVIPLCATHHEYNSADGLHANIGRWRRIYGRERDIVKFLFDYFNEPYPEVLLQ